MSVTPILIVLVFFIAAIALVTGIYMLERGVARVSQALGSTSAHAKTNN